MNIRKKILYSAITVSLIMSFILSGCYIPIPVLSTKGDADTLTITLGNRNFDYLMEALQNKFPEINFEFEPVYCSNVSGYLRHTLTTGNSSDIFYYSQSPTGKEAAENLLDLSGYDFISNFDRSIINTFLVDGRIYCIPGPLMIRGVAYNKTLFEEHGWKKPESHDELVELCKLIRAETDDITPISMALGAVGYPFTLITTFSQAGFLNTPDGEAWEKRFLAGNASVSIQQYR